MARYYFPGHVEYKRENWADRQTQSKPYVNPLPYTRFDATEHLGRLEKVGTDTYYDQQYNEWWYPGGFWNRNQSVRLALMASGFDLPAIESFKFHNKIKTAQNAALEKIDDDLTQVANLFEDWYERKASYELLANVGKELYAFVTGWRKPKYWQNRLGKAKQPTSLPEAWITYQFGVKPLIGSVDTILHNLARPLKDVNFKQTSGCSYEYHTSRGEGVYRTFHKRDIKYRYTLGCTVKSNPNPNLGLANVVGLGQPFSTAFAVIPWGWAVDYFVNASQLLSNIEQKHPGVNVGNWYSTTKWDITESTRQHVTMDLWANSNLEMHQMNRAVNIDTPKFHMVFDVPLLGSNKTANLFSAIALTMKKG